MSRFQVYLKILEEPREAIDRLADDAVEDLRDDPELGAEREREVRRLRNQLELAEIIVHGSCGEGGDVGDRQNRA